MAFDPLDAQPQVAVVGAGPAGIAAAFRLEQAGYHPKIFEADDRVGGRTKTTRRDGFSFDSGALNCLSSYDHMLAIVDEAGLGDHVVKCGSMIGLPHNGRMHYIDGDQRVRDIPRLARSGALSWRAKLRAARLAYDVVRARRQLSYTDLWRAQALDNESAGAYARRVLDEEILDVIVDNVVRGSAVVNADELSKADFFFALGKWMGVQLLTFRDGMGTYAEMMAPRFDIALETPVVEIDDTGSEVLVTSRPANGNERTERMAGCVVAVPAAASAEIVPKLDTWRAKYLRELRYTRSVVVTVAQAKPVDQPAALFLTPRSSTPDVSVVTVANKMTPWRVPVGKGLVAIIAASDIGERLIDADDDTVVNSLLPVIEQVQPGLTGDIEWCHVDRWDPLLPVHRPGFTQDLARFKQVSDATDRRIQFAGDYWSLACVETSTASGERAGRLLAEHLRQPATTTKARPAAMG